MTTFLNQQFVNGQLVNMVQMNEFYNGKDQTLTAYFPINPSITNGIIGVQTGTSNTIAYTSGVFRFENQTNANSGTTAQATFANYTGATVTITGVPSSSSTQYYVVAQLTQVVTDAYTISNTATILSTAMTIADIEAEPNPLLYLIVSAINNVSGVYTIFSDSNCVFNYGIKLESYMQGRIYGVSGNPTEDTTSGGSSTLYFGNYNGNLISLYNGYYWVAQTFSEISYDLTTVTANEVYDVYVTSTGGSTISMSLVQWSDLNTPPVRSIQDGQIVQYNTPTELFVGSILVDSSSVVFDYSQQRYIANQYNTINKVLYSTATGATITSTTPQIQGSGLECLIINPTPNLSVTNSVNNINVTANQGDWGNTLADGSTTGNTSYVIGTGTFPCSFTSVVTPVVGYNNWNILWWVITGSAVYGTGHLTIGNIFV